VDFGIASLAGISCIAASEIVKRTLSLGGEERPFELSRQCGPQPASDFLQLATFAGDSGRLWRNPESTMSPVAVA
jgi:hypothetical protein